MECSGTHFSDNNNYNTFDILGAFQDSQGHLPINSTQITESHSSVHSAEDKQNDMRDRKEKAQNRYIYHRQPRQYCIFQLKYNVWSCESCRVVKLMSHTIKF